MVGRQYIAERSYNKREPILVEERVKVGDSFIFQTKQYYVQSCEKHLKGKFLLRLTTILSMIK